MPSNSVRWPSRKDVYELPSLFQFQVVEFLFYLFYNINTKASLASWPWPGWWEMHSWAFCFLSSADWHGLGCLWDLPKETPCRTPSVRAQLGKCPSVRVVKSCAPAELVSEADGREIIEQWTDWRGCCLRLAQEPRVWSKSRLPLWHLSDPGLWSGFLNSMACQLPENCLKAPKIHKQYPFWCHSKWSSLVKLLRGQWHLSSQVPGLNSPT